MRKSRPIWDYFIYDGITSISYGVKISSADSTWSGSERDIETVEVPGRNGELVYDNGRYKNAPIEYACWMTDGFPDNYDSFRAWINKHQTSYYRLEDTNHPDEFRLARVSAPLDPTLHGLPDSAEFSLSLSAKPQRFLKNGEIFVDVADGSTVMLNNPTLETALPLIRVIGSGTLTVGNVTITVAENSLDYIDIDSELKRCYCGSTQADEYAPVTTWPTLDPGKNGVTQTGFTSVKIEPRWFMT